MNASLRLLVAGVAQQMIGVPPGRFVIGRETDCDFQAESAFVSRHHCVLLADEHTLRIHDLCSRNGTYINGSRLGSHESILLDGDTLGIGDLILQVNIQFADPLGPFTDSEAPTIDPSQETQGCGSTVSLALEALPT